MFKVGNLHRDSPDFSLFQHLEKALELSHGDHN